MTGEIVKFEIHNPGKQAELVECHECLTQSSCLQEEPVFDRRQQDGRPSGFKERSSLDHPHGCRVEPVWQRRLVQQPDGFEGQAVGQAVIGLGHDRGSRELSVLVGLREGEARSRIEEEPLPKLAPSPEKVLEGKVPSPVEAQHEGQGRPRSFETRVREFESRPSNDRQRLGVFFVGPVLKNLRQLFVAVENFGGCHSERFLEVFDQMFVRQNSVLSEFDLSRT